jgi:hypothetical protein
MQDQPKIPHGYKRVVGQLQKGDGIWNGTRFAKVRKQYPFVGLPLDVIAIRKREVVQEVLPGIEPAITPQDAANIFSSHVKRLCDQANAAMDAAQSELIERMATGVAVMDLD